MMSYKLISVCQCATLLTIMIFEIISYFVGTHIAILLSFAPVVFFEGFLIFETLLLLIIDVKRDNKLTDKNL